MSRNTFEAIHYNCSQNNGESKPFQVIIGNPPICPNCGQVVKTEPFSIKGEREIPVSINTDEKK